MTNKCKEKFDAKFHPVDAAVQQTNTDFVFRRNLHPLFLSSSTKRRRWFRQFPGVTPVHDYRLLDIASQTRNWLTRDEPFYYQLVHIPSMPCIKFIFNIQTELGSELSSAQVLGRLHHEVHHDAWESTPPLPPHSSRSWICNPPHCHKLSNPYNLF